MNTYLVSVSGQPGTTQEVHADTISEATRKYLRANRTAPEGQIDVALARASKPHGYRDARKAKELRWQFEVGIE